LHRDKLEQLKGDARYLDEPDFVWRSLVESASSWGSSRGYHGLFDNADNYKKVTFVALSGLSPGDRLSVLAKTLRAAKVRMPDKKAAYLSENFRIIEEMGGLAAAKSKLLSQQTRESKMAFLQRFRGIGPKYARNIFMNVHHPDFRQSIAVDARIKTISEELRLTFNTYADAERFYLGVAHEAGLSGWELDRVLYKFKAEVLVGLRQRS